MKKYSFKFTIKNTRVHIYIFVLIFWGILGLAQGAQGFEFYGVKFAPIDDYQELASLGVMNPVTVVYNNSDIDRLVSTARTLQITYPNFKPIPWWQWASLSCANMGSSYRSFINYITINNYWDDILAVYGFHEVLGTSGSVSYCADLSQVVAVADEIRQLSGGKAKLFGKLYSDTSYGGVTTVFADGICDYCGVLYHPYRANPYEFRKSQMLSDLNRDINLIKSVQPNKTLNKFIPYLCTVDYPGVYGTGLYMPYPAEMEDGGNSIINFVSTENYKPDGFVWYSWSGEQTAWQALKEYNDDGQKGDSQAKTGRMGVIYQLSGGDNVNTKTGDLNNSGHVDVVDLGIFLSNWGKTTKPSSDINQDGQVNVIDLGILLSNWQS